MAQNNSISVVGLDFSEIKESLKSYLQTQDILKDYNFDGSVLNTLLDVLAYNSHYQAFYSNMIANEMFLDTALLRQSIVSHAKHLGYLPSSVKAARAIVNINLSSVASSDTYLARGTEFSGTNSNGTRYKFVNMETVFADAGATSFDSVELYEGTIRRITYIYNRDTKIGSYLIIPNNKADISTIKVNVYNSVTDTTGITDVWTNGSEYLTLTPTSKVYFLQEKDAGIYELYFGDGILGEQPKTGNVVSIEYLETNGEAGNGVTQFTQSDSSISSIEFDGDATSTNGGTDRESTGSIKYNAPRFYQTGNRAVTENDYASLIYKNYPNVSSINVYGGETVVPPQYGNVFIAIKPKFGGVFSSSEKISLEQDLKQNNSIITITPKVVDPDYIDLVFDMSVVYNPNTLFISSGELKSLLFTYIYGYSVINMEKFGENFYYSKMIEGMSGIHQSVLGIYSTIKLRKIVDSSVITRSKSYKFKFGNALYNPQKGYVSVLTSNTIPHRDLNGDLYTDCTLQDDGNGTINVVRSNVNSSSGYTIVYPSVGTIDYDFGEVLLNSNFSPETSVLGGALLPIIITVEPRTTNINVSENRILRINPIYVDSVKISLTTEN